MPATLPLHDNQMYLKALPNISMEEKSLAIENHWYIDTDEHYIDVDMHM